MKFKDLNFKIAIIGALHELGYYSQEAEQIKNQNLDWDEEFRPIPEVLEFYKKLEINPEYLKEIEVFEPDSNDLSYSYLFNIWDGAGELLDITSIEGIELLTNLHTFDPVSMINEREIDFSPLLKCKNLKYISTDFMHNEQEEVIERLLEKGVEIL